MRFEEVYTHWQVGQLIQEEAADILGVCAHTYLGESLVILVRQHFIITDLKTRAFLKPLTFVKLKFNFL